MFLAANESQRDVLNRYLTPPNKEINLRGGKVDGKDLFKPDGGSLGALIAIRSCGTLADRCFFLNSRYDWQLIHDDKGALCLKPERKFKN